MVYQEPQKITVVGLGYVGLPLSCLLSTKFEVFGFDINQEKISRLKQGIDETNEVENLSKYKVEFSADPSVINQATFIIVSVPTPVDQNNQPDLSMLEKASEIVGQNLAKDSIVVFESTVFPGCTEEVCLPILEKESGLNAGTDFKIGYSPERINPGDKERTIEKLTKVVSGQDPESLEIIAKVYGAVIPDIFKATNIKTAEAAKVIENIQRDLNIALVNEFSLIFKKLGINTKEVLEAAGTKWNFHKYSPGLVGGHCIPVDPYYLTYKAKQVGYGDPKVILTGREINNSMAAHVAENALNLLKDIKNPKVLIMGLTFKENVSDTRNSKVKDIIKILKNKTEIKALEPMLTPKIIKEEFAVEAASWPINEKFDLVLVFAPHDQFKDIKLENLLNIMNEQKILMDLREFYNKEEASKLNIDYWSL
jgi:UDP-N-acetyl-D-galactosamine dehydrogenase